VTVRGSPDYLSLDHLWQDIADACNRHDCFKILGVSESENWGADEAYDHAAIFEAAGITTGHRIAWIEKNGKSKASIKLAETVVLHRGLATAQAFDDIAEAKHWLLETTGAGT
jgi:hypothetical protein